MNTACRTRRPGSRRSGAGQGWAILLLVLGCIHVAAPAQAQGPREIAYQGILTDDFGVPVPDGLYELDVTLYDAATGGTVLHNEVFADVPTMDGRFTLTLGSTVPLTLAFDAPYWLGLRVDADPELVPRIPLAAAPYALSLPLPFSGSASGPEPTMWIENSTPAGKALSAYPDLSAGGGVFQLEIPKMLMGLQQDPALGYLTLRKESTSGAASIQRSTVLTHLYLFEYSVLLSLSSDPEFRAGHGPTATTLSPAGATLPPNTIDAAERSDETGASSSSLGFGSVALGSTPTVLRSTTLDCPADGYVLVLATCEAVIAHVGGTTSLAAFAISDDSAGPLPASRDVHIGLPTSLSSGTAKIPVSVQATLPVSAGPSTFHLLGRENFGTFSVEDVQLTAVFVPTAYGSVSSAPVVHAEVPVSESVPAARRSSQSDAAARAETIRRRLRESFAVSRDGARTVEEQR